MTTANISVSSPAGLVSIIIPCVGMLEYTKLCVPSVLRCSREPVELIFIDIGSLDGTAEYVAGLRDGLADRIRVEVCRATIDDDIGAACKDANLHPWRTNGNPRVKGQTPSPAGQLHTQ